ncbi:MAG TPA: glycoside hydrolase [Terriglobia bacterium]|nr:glycoside hydrolase [Terriglobia bacterium]
MTRIRAFIIVTLACVFSFAVASPVGAQQLSNGMIQDMRWRMIGPFRGGRTRAACGVPSEPNVFYVGQVDGGVWKSDDYGRTWTPIFDKEPTQSIGAIAVAPSDPNVIYVASGEGLARPDLSVGDGIYKSTDAGKTWTHVWTVEGEQIPALAIDPRNPNRVFAAVLGHPYGPNPDRGIYRSTDGGKSWQNVFYVDQNTGGDDVEIDPANPSVVYTTLWEVRQGPWEYGNEYQGTQGGIFKSTDGGKTWRKLANGLPSDLVQAYVAVAPSEPSRLYATIATTHEGGYGSGAGLGIYRSDDGGDHWYRATTDPRPAAKIGGGDLPVPRVDPKNPDVVYVTSIVTWRSTDGGKTWTAIKGAPGGDDYQNIWINPENPDIILLVSDQGAVVSVNRGRAWSSWYNQPTAQLYHVEASNTFPYRVCSGQQESGSVCIAERGNDGEITVRDWRTVGAEEYAYVAPDPLHPDIVYGAGTNNVTKFHWSTGQVQDVTPIPIRTGKYRVDRTQPIIFSPVEPHVLYYAASVLFKTVDGGHSWQAISPDLSRPSPGVPGDLGSMAAKDNEAAKQRGVIYALGPSFTDVNTIWAGTDDGFIWVTRDGGKHWNNVTPPDMTAWSKVTQITASHFDDDTAYASVNRFRIDDLRPYIYRTHDGGTMWELITNGLPRDAPVDTVREDPVRKGLLFAGTETGVWVSFDDGNHWQSLQLNLPHTSMRDLWIHDHDLIVATHGRSFWILDDITPLEQMTDAVAHSEATLFRPEPAYRVRRDTNTDTPLPPETPTGKNPPDGAIIDYYLGQPASGPVALDILDANENLVRHYASTQKPAVKLAELKKTLEIPLYWVRAPRVLPSSAGMHRWVWDLHYPPPASTARDYPISAVPHDTPRLPLGPRALPGRYTVRLTANGHSYTEPLVVRMDPRVKVSTAALTQQFHVEMQLASMMTQVAQAVRQARSVQTQVQQLSKETTGSLGQSVKTLNNNLGALLGAQASFFGPVARNVTLGRVNGEVGTLYGSVDSADAAPTVPQMEALSKVEGDFSAMMARWREIETTEIQEINRQLISTTLPVIRVAAK